MSPSNYLGHLLIWIVVVTLSHSLNATEAVVTVLRAPLFKQRSFKSAIVQYLSRGEKLFIHARDIGGHSYQEHYDSLHFDRSTLQGTVLSQIPDDGETLIVDLDRMEDVEGYLDSMIDADQKDGQLYFVQTIDRRGAVAYVAREHIKIIYRDDRENDKPVSSLPRDYTDYRLTEPLPDGYPLHRLEQYRLQILTGGGGQRKVNYNYRSAVAREDFSLRTGLAAHFQKGLEFDQTNRFFFGGMVNIFSGQSDLRLANGNFAQELKLDIGIGPTLSYDLFRRPQFRLTLYGGFSFLFTRAFVLQQLPTGSSEERSFWDLTISPRVGQILQAREILGKLDLVLVGDFAFHLPHSLERGKGAVLTTAWNSGENDQIDYPFGGELTLMFGVQTNY